MTADNEPQDFTVQAASSTYVVRRAGDELRLGQQTGDTVLWQDETVPLDRLPERARAALEAGDRDSADLQLALHALAEAFAQRGG
jgi:hypothetical protein